MGEGGQQPTPGVTVSSASYQYTDTPSAEAMTNTDEEEFARLTPEGQKCLMEFWNSLPLEGLYCNTTWDTLYCWPATRAGQTVRESCATVFSDVPDLVNYPEAYAYRECDQAGVWLWGGWTNYSQCLSVIDHKDDNSAAEAVSYITFIGALLSLFTLIITIFIFTYFRTLECDRLRVHRNLVASLIIRFVVMLVLTEPFVSNRQTSYRDVDWLCKTLLAVRMYAQMASINWMFVEGLFLHSRLTSNVFDSGAPFPLYYTIGWGVPLVFIVAWAVTMSLHYPVHCWEAYPSLKYTWILVAPMVTALMINLLFLINIIRILVTKLRASDAQVRQHRNYQLKQHHNLRQRRNMHTAKDSQQTDFRGSGHEDEQQSAFDLQRTKGKKTQYTCCGCLPCRRLQRPEKKTSLQVVTKKPVIQISYYEDEHEKPKYSQRETSTTLYYERTPSGKVPERQSKNLEAQACYKSFSASGDRAREKQEDLSCQQNQHSNQQKEPKRSSEQIHNQENNTQKRDCSQSHLDSGSQLDHLRTSQNSLNRTPSSQPSPGDLHGSQDGQQHLATNSQSQLKSPHSPLPRQDPSLSPSHKSENGQGSPRHGYTNNLQHHPSLGYAVNRPEFNVRKAIKATIVLFPLLGITNLLFAVNPGDKGELEGAYMITNALLQSSQGVFVSVLYCFLNSEVQDIIRKRWRQYRMQQCGYPPQRRKSTRCTIILPPTFSMRPMALQSSSALSSRVQSQANLASETSVV